LEFLRKKWDTWGGENVWALSLILAFVVTNAILFANEIYILSAIPFLLFLGLLLLFSIRSLYYILILLTPLSVPLRHLVPGLAFDFWVPTEPIILSVLLVIILKSIKEGHFDRELTRHPVFWVIALYLGWILISIVPSEMHVVSVKYFLVRFWYVGVFFYFNYLLFIQKPRLFRRLIILYIASLSVVIAFSLIRLSAYGFFDKYGAHGSCYPFFIDHPSYGAALAFAIPMIFALAVGGKSIFTKLLFGIFTLLFTIALVLSYSRAAWLSLIVAGGVWILWLFRLRAKTIAISGLLAVALMLIFQDSITSWLTRNSAESSGDLGVHLKSVSNVTSDASNVERINRWTCAIRMFRERPLFGWGPGTYMFQYAPFQSSYLKTPESSNLGRRGDAHSEYLGLLAQSGLPAALGYLALLVVVLYRGFKMVRLVRNRMNRLLLLASLLGLVTYAVHGVMNNFLDVDKIAFLFWGSIAFVVAMDIRTRRNLGLPLS